MKKLMMLVLGGMLAAAMPLWADTGYTWTYQINGDTAEIYRPHEWSDAISPIPTGAVAMPSTLGGKPVTSIGGYAFYNYSGSGEGGGKTGGGEIADLDDWMNAVLNRRATFSLGADITIDMTRGNVVVARTWVDSGETKVMGYTDEGCKCEVDYSHPRKWSDDVYSISGTDIHSGVHTFTGMLQGNGHTLKIEGGPLFSFAKGATFENVTFDGDSISSASNCKFVGCTSKTAPLAATAEDCEFSQCVGAVSGSTQASFAKRATGCFFEGCSAQVEIAFSGDSNGTGIGAFVGTATDCTFKGCSAKGSVVGDKKVGGLVGTATGSTFTDCSSSCTVKGSQQVGGFIGCLDDGTDSASCTVRNCKATGNVSGRGWTGGFVGSIDNCKVSNCTATGNVTDDETITAASSTDDYFGGFVGHVSEGTSGGSVIECCKASGSITATVAEDVGGFAGLIFGNSQVQSTVRKCCATGNVTGGNNVGGFSGSARDCTISDCCATGSATSQGIGMQSEAGGMIGSYTVDGALSRCYASGSVTVSGSATMAYSGGLMPIHISPDMLDMYASSGMLDMMIGTLTTSSVACYWNKTATGQNYSGTGTGLTAAQVGDQASFAGWDFDGTWKMENGHPVLNESSCHDNCCADTEGEDGDGGNEGPACGIYVNSSHLEIAGCGGSASTTISSTNEWSASRTSGDASLSFPSGGTAGKGQTFSVSAPENNSGKTLTWLINIDGGCGSTVVTVTQPPCEKDCGISVDNEVLRIPACGGSASTALSSTNSWRAALLSGDPQLEYPESGPKGDNQLFTVTASPNKTGSMRIWTITIDGGCATRTLRIEQSDCPEPCAIHADDAILEIDPCGGEVITRVDSTNGWRSALVSGDTTLLFTGSSSGGRRRTFRASAPHNLTRETRTWIVRLDGECGSFDIMIMQGYQDCRDRHDTDPDVAPGTDGCAIVASVTNMVLAGCGADAITTVASTNAWTATLVSGDPCLTFTESGHGGAEGVFSVSAPANMTGSARKWEIRIDGGCGSVDISVIQPACGDENLPRCENGIGVATNVLSISNCGGSSSTKIASAADWAATLVSGDSSLTFTKSGLAGTGVVFSVSAPANTTGFTRTWELELDGRCGNVIIMVVQAAGECGSDVASSCLIITGDDIVGANELGTNECYLVAADKATPVLPEWNVLGSRNVWIDNSGILHVGDGVLTQEVITVVARYNGYTATRTVTVFGPGIWTSDPNIARQEAERSGKLVVVKLSNHDTCGYCKSFDMVCEGFEFLSWARTHGVYLVSADASTFQNVELAKDYFYALRAMLPDMPTSVPYPSIAVALSYDLDSAVGCDVARSGKEIGGVNYDGTVGTLIEGLSFYLSKCCTIKFDPAGGIVAERCRHVLNGASIGTMPTPVRSGYVFDGWFDSPTGGDRLQPSTIVEYDGAIYAHWSVNSSDTKLQPVFAVKDGILVEVVMNGATEITIPPDVTGIGQRAFYKCATLRQVILPSGLKWIGDQAFTLCGNLENIIIPDGVQHIGVEAFLLCPKLKTIYFDGDAPTVGENAFASSCGIASVAYVHRESTGWGVNIPGIWNGVWIKYIEDMAAIFTVTFNANGGSVSPSSRDVEKDAFVGSLPIPTRIGYTFTGWWTTANGGIQVTESTKVTGNVTYYAHWSQEIEDQPNLSVSSVSACRQTVYIGETFHLRYAVMNTGKASAGSSAVGISDSNKRYYATPACGSLAAGATQSYRANISSSVLGVGTHTLTVTADTSGQVTESSEADNSKTIYLTVLSLPETSATVDWQFHAKAGSPAAAYLSKSPSSKVATTTFKQGEPICVQINFWNALQKGTSGEVRAAALLDTGKGTQWTWTNLEGGKVAYIADSVMAANSLQNLPPGTYTLEILLDNARFSGGTYVWPEASKLNNAMTIEFTVLGNNTGSGTLPAPDLDVAGQFDRSYAKAQTELSALFDKDGALVGSVQIKAGKLNARTGKVRVSASVTLLVGGKAKKVSAKAVNVDVGEATGASLPQAVLPFKAPIGEMAFALEADGTFTLKNASYVAAEATVGGALKGGVRGTFRLAGFDLAVPGELQEDLLPYEVAFDVAGDKWKFAKAAGVKWAKDKATQAFGRVVDESNGKTNRASLKLTYTAKTGIFKGAFKAYALEDAAGGKKKLKKYTVNVLGLVTDGKGQGEASCKKPAGGPWAVGVE